MIEDPNKFDLINHLTSLKLLAISDAFDRYIFLSRVKDGAIVPGQVGLSGPPTLVRGPYPHEDTGFSQQVPGGLARGQTVSVREYGEWEWFLTRIRPDEFSGANTL